MRLASLVVAGSLIAFVVGEAQAQSPAQPTPPARPVATKPAAPGKAEITWYGHAAFRIQTPRGKSILIDPWLTNPSNKNGKTDAGAVAADLILVSHGHDDHVGDAIAIGRRTKAKLVTTFDLGKALVTAGYPAGQAGIDSQGNVGGTVELLDGEVKISFVPAVHSSQVSRDKAAPLDAGNPGGFLVAIQGGPTIYHTGDTDVFGDMALIQAHRPVDVMLACIGGHFTMDPARAARAAKLVKARTIVPMHYGTFPLLKGTPDELAAQLKKAGARARMRPLAIGAATAL